MRSRSVKQRQQKKVKQNYKGSELKVQCAPGCECLAAAAQMLAY